MNINQTAMTTAFVVITCLIALVTILIVIYHQAKSRKRSFLLLSFFISCSLVIAWFTIGFSAILFGHHIDTATFFRPFQAILISLLTTAIVLVYRSKILLDEYEQINDDVNRQLRDCNGNN